VELENQSYKDRECSGVGEGEMRRQRGLQGSPKPKNGRKTGRQKRELIQLPSTGGRGKGREGGKQKEKKNLSKYKQRLVKSRVGGRDISG